MALTGLPPMKGGVAQPRPQDAPRGIGQRGLAAGLTKRIAGPPARSLATLAWSAGAARAGARSAVGRAACPRPRPRVSQPARGRGVGGPREGGKRPAGQHLPGPDDPRPSVP